MGSFIRDLRFSQEIEKKIADAIKTKCSDVELTNTKEQDIIANFKIEVKRERSAQKTGNVAIEVEYKGKPSGPYASEADIWIWEIDGAYWMAHIDVLRRFIEEKDAYYQVKYGGDGKASKLLIVPMIHFCNHLATKIYLDVDR